MKDTFLADQTTTQIPVTLTYSADFARTLWIPFKVGSHTWDLITRHGSEISEFIANPDNWLAMEYRGERHKYTRAEMHSRWHCIECQKYRVQAFYLMSIGKFRAFDPAIESLGGMPAFVPYSE